MSKNDYLSWAQQARDKEKRREWDEACELWLKAKSNTHASSQNHRWALARAIFCNVQLPPNHRVKFEDHL